MKNKAIVIFSIISGIINSVIIDITILYLVTATGLLSTVSNVSDNTGGMIFLIIAVVSVILGGYVGYCISISIPQSKPILYLNYVMAIVIIIAMIVGFDTTGV